ncbi:MAG: methyl-accepting chemotaxis protein, partial [Gammaproteobacteria bacterium]|nr:methyl-accepting chemotaxis protein [Gammaproteobacteria bacterium]
ELQQLDPEHASVYTEMTPAFDAYYNAGKTMARAYVAEGPTAGNRMMSAFDEKASKLAKMVDDFVVSARTRADAALMQQKQMSESALTQIWISGVTVTVFVLILFFTMSGALRVLPEIVNQLHLLADGDLTVTNKINRGDEIGDLAITLNKMLDSLQQMIARIRGMSDQLTDSSSELQLIVNKADETTAQQRSETDQVATAMNEMTAAVHEVANNISHAANAAKESNDETRNGQQVVGQTVARIQELAKNIEAAADTVRQLEQDSQKITAVLEVIKGVAEQTNLLALNAAIEAARAGEQGRGFAVVADEVRTLASRTQRSTEEINKMIAGLLSGTRDAVTVMTTSRDHVRSVVDQAFKANASLNNIAEAVARIHDMSAQIASSSEEQGAVAEEINRNIVKIGGMTEDAAEVAKYVAATTQDLAALAVTLRQECSRFKT